MLYFHDWMLEKKKLASRLLVCVIVCTCVDGVGSVVKAEWSRMDSTVCHKSNHQTNVNVPHNYIHVCKMIEKDKAFSSPCFSFAGGCWV